MTTQAQTKRQRARSTSGKYSAYPKCHYCGKPAPGNYHSARLIDSEKWSDNGLVLHARCADIVNAMPEDEALAAIRATRERIGGVR